MNINPLVYVAAIGAAAVLILLVILVISAVRSSKNDNDPSTGVSINTPEGSIVTVRKIGRTTRVEIRNDIHDHWEGSSGIEIKPVGIETTRKLEPELFAEYMDPHTSAIRRYEIADYIYSMGLTLPYIKGLVEQWHREVGETARGSDAHPPTGKLDVNRSVGDEPLPAMEPEDGDIPPEESSQQTQWKEENSSPGSPQP